MKFSIEVERQKHGLQKIRGLDPSLHPEFVGRSLAECMALVIATSKRTQLSGPRPVELDRVTGELAASLDIDRSGLPFGVTGGTSLPWAPVHEFGRRGLHSFLEPAVDIALPRFPEIVEREWLRSFDHA